MKLKQIVKINSLKGVKNNTLKKELGILSQFENDVCGTHVVLTAIITLLSNEYYKSSDICMWCVIS